jgi:hypothetical protein
MIGAGQRAILNRAQRERHAAMGTAVMKGLGHALRVAEQHDPVAVDDG